MKQLSLLISLIFISFNNPYSYLKAKYVSATLSDAIFVELMYDIPLELTLAQSALESAWGQSYNAKNRCNYFGITNKDGTYRVFNSKRECFNYYGRLMSNRYQDCISLHYQETIKCIHSKGYAEDQNYTKKLIRIFRQVNRMV